MFFMIQTGQQAADPSFWAQPAVIAALISGSVAITSIVATVLTNHFLQRQRILFDDRLANRRFEFDRQLAENKAQLDSEIDIWKRKSSFAELALTDFYEARDTIRAIRSPMSYDVENDDRPGRDQEAQDVRRNRDMYYPITRRVRDKSDFFNSFYSKRYRAVAWFGQEIEEPYREIWQVLNEIAVAAGMLMRGMHGADDALERFRAKIWEGLEEDDALLRRVNASVEKAENAFRPVVVARPASVTGEPVEG